MSFTATSPTSSSPSSPPSTPYDPYQILCVSCDFTLNELNTKYRRLARQLHPDKNSMDANCAAEIFKILNASYKSLLEDHNRRQGDKQYFELKSGAQPVEAPVSASAAKKSAKEVNNFFKGENGGFDSSKFNSFFVDNKLSGDPFEAGYGSWLKQEEYTPPPQTSKSSKHSVPSECRDLQLHVDTYAFGRNKLAFAEMGVDEIDDFSIDCATDLRLAYSDQNGELEGLADGRVRESYTSVEELEKSRAQLSHSLDSVGQAAYEKYRNWNADREHHRKQQLTKRDQVIGDHYARLNQLITHR
jgi:curved DNA-binding protein CbpA